MANIKTQLLYFKFSNILITELLKCYKKVDVCNVDETGYFWKALHNQGFDQKAKEFKGSKSCKQRLTIVFMANASGSKETPIVILKSENLRCLRKCIKLNFQLILQLKAQMIGEIIDSMLLKVISNFKLQIVFLLPCF